MMNQDEKELLIQKYTEVSHRLKVANSQLEQAKAKLQEYEDNAHKALEDDRMKWQFMANMAHDIRTPLNAIEGFAEIIAFTDSPEDRMNYLDIIRKNNSRLLTLVNDILNMTRMKWGEMVIKKNPTDLNEMMDSIKSLFKFRCPDTVVLSWTKDEDNISMMTDENRLTQVFTNLISNALKHTPKGSIVYGYHLINDNREIEFYVNDTGTGISPDFIEHIFDTYASQDAEQQKGFGLGLTICRLIVEKMGGHIDVKSTLGQGSTFTFTLPFRGVVGGMTISNRTNTESLNSLRASSMRDGKEMKTVLVAEDEESNYELVRILLEKHYKLLRAHNGIEAVTLNEDEKPDLILMDIRMPDMNGLDATRIIKEVDHDTPIIAVSAYAFEENIREAKAAGCDDFLSKPYDVDALLNIIKKHID